MVENTVYLITGANRGIGNALAALLVSSRPQTTVIATSRSLSSSSDQHPPSPYANVKPHESSRLIPMLLDESNPEIDSSTLPGRLAAEAGIKKIDVVIANAGNSVGFKSVDDTEVEDIRADLEVNLVNVVKLFKCLRPLLLPEDNNNNNSSSSNSSSSSKKFVVISSSVGSIAGLAGGEGGLPACSYGISKAAVNWWAQKAAFEYKSKGLLVGVIHPGWVKTGMGQGLADAVGVQEPPLTTEESAKGVMEQVDGLTEEKTSQFLMYDGKVLQW